MCIGKTWYIQGSALPVVSGIHWGLGTGSLWIRGVLFTPNEEQAMCIEHRLRLGVGFGTPGNIYFSLLQGIYYRQQQQLVRQRCLLLRILC